MKEKVVLKPVRIVKPVTREKLQHTGSRDMTAEKEIFYQLQQNFVPQYEAVFHDKMAEKTVVVIPSLTL